jgi:hypothetical protein
VTDRPQTPGMDDLEVALVDLAGAIAFPATPDLAAAVAARLHAAASSGAAGLTVSDGRAADALRPTGRARPGPIRRSLARSLLLAAALALLLVGGALAVRFGLDLLSIEFGPLPSPRPGSSAAVVASGASASAAPTTPAGPVGEGLRLGAPRTLEDVRAEAPFDILVPDELGPPDAIYLGGRELRGQVALVYEPRPGLPASATLDGAGLLVTQNRGETDEGLAHKLVDAGLASVVAIDIDGAPGYWISGEPHAFWYLAPDGTSIEDSGRLVGDTLIWERGGVLYRIEGAISREQALQIAASMQ